MNPLKLGRERLLLLGVVAALGLLLLDRLVLTPVTHAWQAQADEIRRLQLDLAQGAGVIRQESAWTRQRETMQSRLLPAAAGDAESTLLVRVDQCARAAGLAVASLRPRWRQEGGRRSLLELQVAGQGSPIAAVSFLHHLETAPLALAVEQVEIVPRDANGGLLALDVRLSALCQDVPGKGDAGR